VLHKTLSTSICVAILLAGLGCGSESRPSQSTKQLLDVRTQTDAWTASAMTAVSDQLVRRAKAQYDDYKAGRRPDPPVIDILIISGGGDWGAFGAAFLKGWSRVPRNDPLAQPQFAAVTGVSTGALIAPFAFLEDDASLSTIENLYRNPKSDWIERRAFAVLPDHESLTTISGLERDIRNSITPEALTRIADAATEGRVLLVGTTNLDDDTPRVFDVVAEAKRAKQTGDHQRFGDVLLASAAIPGVFPPRLIDNHMYVDGGVTGNIIYGGRMSERDSLAARWHQFYPDIPTPRIRYWILFNDQLRSPPQVTERRWVTILTKSMDTGTRAATVTAMKHLAAMAEIEQLRWHADVQVRVASIPGDWQPPTPEPFDKGTMNQLADMGEKMGADPASWQIVEP
jgi:predicted acylesterase/phospholipase RssA